MVAACGSTVCTDGHDQQTEQTDRTHQTEVLSMLSREALLAKQSDDEFNQVQDSLL